MAADHNAIGFVENIHGPHVPAPTEGPSLPQGTITVETVTGATPMTTPHGTDTANPVGPIGNMRSQASTAQATTAQATTASDSGLSDSEVSETDADDEPLLESDGDDDIVEGADVDDTTQQQPSAKCARMAAAAGMAGYSDWNFHEWLIIRVQAALDDPEGLLHRNATQWRATRRNFVYRPDTGSDVRRFFSIGDIIAAQIMCAPAHQHILLDMARGAMGPVWTYALPQSSALFVSAQNVVYAHGFNPSRQALEHEAAREDRSPIWRSRCRLASRGDRWMWYFGESGNSGDHRLNQHWNSKKYLMMTTPWYIGKRRRGGVGERGRVGKDRH